MKKLICLILSVLMLASCFVACKDEPTETQTTAPETTATPTTAAPTTTTAPSTTPSEPTPVDTLKFGMGVYTNVSKASDATEDKAGEGKVAITVAVLTVNEAGRVVACQLDTIENTVKYTADGEAIANTAFKTKYELGYDYMMKAYGAPKEWFEQADAFEGVVVGKTLNEIKALVAEGNKGTADVMAAGCTIMINEFVVAIEKAFANLADSTATADSVLKLAMSVEQSTKDAEEDKAGTNQVDTTIFSAAVDANGKVLVADTDCVQVKFTFDIDGASTYDLTKVVSSKRQLGMAYGMVAYGPATLEWFEQADVFETLCVGKSAAEIVALCVDNAYGTDAVKAAGCTMLVNGFAKAAAKLG